MRSVALFPAHELFAQRGLRRDDEDFSFFVNDFRAADARAEEVKRIFAAVLQLHQLTDVNDLAVRELARGQLFKFGDGGFDFRRLPGLAAGEVGGFETAGVVFVLGFVLFVRGFGARGVRGTEINLQFFREPGDDFVDEGVFVHYFTSATVFRRSLSIQMTFGFRPPDSAAAKRQRTAQSKTLRAYEDRRKSRQRLGVRRPSAAFHPALGRGWCCAHTTALLVQRYFASNGASSVFVFAGQNFLSVRIAFFNAE